MPDVIEGQVLLEKVENIINRGLLAILIIGLVLISFLIYYKNKGKKGVWKKYIGRNLIFCVIIGLVWLVVSLLFWIRIGAV